MLTRRLSRVCPAHPGALRAIVHAACPEVEETIKWSRPHLQYKEMLCQISAFKEHCVMGFWKGALLLPDMDEKESMGHFGRITSLKDLPPTKDIATLVKQAMNLNDDGVETAARAAPKTAARVLAVPDYFMMALKKNKLALAAFEAGSSSFKREYVDSIADAKAEATRLRRKAQARAWLAEGKARNWKYANC